LTRSTLGFLLLSFLNLEWIPPVIWRVTLELPLLWFEVEIECYLIVAVEFLELKLLLVALLELGFLIELGPLIF
jgi:hypothetical protein